MPDLPIEQLMLVVVGAHLRAETGDRPLAYGLAEDIKGRLQRLNEHFTYVPVVCTDVWYLNNTELHEQPVISLGGPGVNGLSAFLYPKLPTALAVEDKLVVQVDVEMNDLRSAVWGVDAQHSAAAIDLFAKKYLDDFLNAAVDDVPPEFD